jgi:hypothetical protein
LLRNLRPGSGQYHVSDEINECLARGLNNRPIIRSHVYASLFASAFMVFFFVWSGREKAIKSAGDLLNSEYRHFHLINDRIPLTTLHVIFHIPLGLFCAGTLAAPIFAIASLGSAITGCASSL